MAGLHFSAFPTTSPAGRIGTVQVPSLDPAPILGVDGVTHWWSAEDATLSGGAMTLAPRAGGQSLTGGASKSPDVTTVGGKPALFFNSNAFLNGASSIQNLSAYTWIVVIEPIAALTTSVVLGWQNEGNGHGTTVYAFNSGEVRAQNRTLEQEQSNSGNLVGGTTTILAVGYDGTSFHFGFDGVLDVTRTADTAGASPAPDSFRVGAARAENLKGKYYIKEIIQLNFDGFNGTDPQASGFALINSQLNAHYSIY